MVFAQKLIKISFEFVFQNDLHTYHLIHEKSMVKSTDNNLTTCFWAQTTSTYTESHVGCTNKCRPNKFRVPKPILAAENLAQSVALVLKCKRGYTRIHLK